MANKKQVKNLDDAIGCGRYQIVHGILYQWIVFLLSSNVTVNVFLKKVPSMWTCASWSQNQTGITDPVNVKTICQLIKDKTCDIAEPVLPLDFFSIVPEWHLICDQANLVFWSITIQMFGILVGCPIGGQISDWFGRKWALFWSVISLIAFGSASAFSTSILSFTILRFFIGISCGFVMVINYVYTTEFLKPKHRLWVTSIGSWPLSQGFLTLFAWLSADWRKLSLIINLAAIPCIPYLFFMKESPRWAIQKSKLKRAEKSLTFITRLNKTDVESEIIEKLAHSNSHNNADHVTVKRVYGIWNMFDTWKLTSYSLVLAFCCFSASTITYIFLLDSDSLVGNHFLNFFLMTSFFRSISGLITILCDSFIKPCGRRIAFIVPFTLISACSVVIFVIKWLDDPYYIKLVSVFTFIAMAVTSPIWITISLSNLELFPTPIRNVSVGFTQTLNRVGAMLAPQLLFMSYLWIPGPYLLCAILAFISTILWLIFIPNTKGRTLPDKMPEKRIKNNTDKFTTISVSLMSNENEANNNEDVPV